MVSVPVAAGLAWQQYRRAARAVGAHPTLAPPLPGHRRQLATSWGSVGYRFVEGDPEAYSGLVALATSAYWVRPKLWLMMAMAPYAMARGSPFLIHTARTELRDTDHMPEHIAWSYTRRPVRRLLDETASELRRFDAREWTDLSLPPTTWVVTTEDSVLSPEHQHALAEHFGAEVIEVEAQHSLVVQRPDTVRQIIERA